MSRKKKTGTIVRYRGLSGRRVIGDYVWEAANDYTTMVSDESALAAIRADLRFEIEEQPGADELAAEEIGETA